MIFKRRISAALLVLLCGAFATSESSDDFKFDSDDLQIVYSDPPEAVMNPATRSLYAKEIAQCPTGESKIMLTLLLQSLRWSDVSERKKEKAIKKLSRFFLVPRQFITVSDIHTPEIIEMLKHSINKSNNLLNTKESVARVEFMIGCGDKMFENGKTIAHQVNEHVKMGALDELSGLPFSWWNIWSKLVKSRVQRMKRQTDGSGNDEDNEEYDYDEDENLDEDEGNSDDDISTNEESTEAPPRVRHPNQRKNKKKQKNIFVKQVQDEPAPEIVVDETESPIYKVEISRAPIVDPPLVAFDSEPIVTERVVESPTPIDDSENKKLESYVNKTIVNDNNVVDVPVFQEKDKMLEEVRKMISEPQLELTTIMVSSIETTTYQPVTETTTEQPATTMQQTEEPTKPSTVLVTFASPPPETETIFVPINNNENISNYEEKLSIETTTVESTTTSQPLEDEITERISTTQVHETTHIPITETLPTTTTEIITTTEPSTTTTLSIVDATLAVDQASTNANELEEEKQEVRPRGKNERKRPDEDSESNYDDEYDDTLEDTLPDVNNVDVESASQIPTTTERRTTQRPTTPEIITLPSTVPTTTEQEEVTTTQQPTTPQTSPEAPSLSASTEQASIDDYEDSNSPPRVEKRIPKAVAIAGKPFSITIEKNVFYDTEDRTDLELELLDKNGQSISTNWIRFDKEKREIYGLPLETDVSRYEFKLRATDKAGEYVDENVDITVQQHKSFRKVNHEIYIQLKLEKNYESPVDWEIRLVRGIVEALGDDSLGSVVVREVRPNKYESNLFTFVYTNETLPTERCPEAELEKLMKRLTKPSLNSAMKQEIIVRNVEKDFIGVCQKRVQPNENVSPINTKNFPPTVVNPVDSLTASTGQLFVHKVPKDTFYDPEDFTELTLSLLNADRSKLEPNHWLQFDSKNREFYGVPTTSDKSQQGYILVAKDRSGLTTNDALVVDIKQGDFKSELSALFTYQLDIAVEQFQNAATKRKFIETVAKVFNDSSTKHILIKEFKKVQYGRTNVVVQNATLISSNHRDCPNKEIEKLRDILLHQDRSVRDEVKEKFKADFPVIRISLTPTGKCAGGDTFHHLEPEQPPRPDDIEAPIINQDVLITYVLPTAIILLMLLIALLIACLLYKRRNTGKMELGDEEERKSFRSKGIPVIFQDELEEKPEIVTKSPIILKDEKPPLLPQYNGLSQDDNDDNMDQYIPPQPLMMGSRESRGKSPVTPSYRRPPPYVSP